MFKSTTRKFYVPKININRTIIPRLFFFCFNWHTSYQRSWERARASYALEHAKEVVRLATLDFMTFISYIYVHISRKACVMLERGGAKEDIRLLWTYFHFSWEKKKLTKKKRKKKKEEEGTIIMHPPPQTKLAAPQNEFTSSGPDTAN